MSAKYSRIISTGSALPAARITNEDLADGSLPTALKLLMNGFVRVPALKLDASSMERRKRLPRWLPQPHRRRLKGAALIPRRLI